MAQIRKRPGNLLLDDAEVLVCPTNAVGVMGLGLAKQFREQIKGLFVHYREHCKRYNIDDMVPYVHRQQHQQIVYCLHTKRHWREKSTVDIVEAGLVKLIAWCRENEIKSIALPMLGCGAGGLDFVTEVEPIIRRLFAPVNLDVRIYIPQ